MNLFGYTSVSKVTQIGQSSKEDVPNLERGDKDSGLRPILP